jgi:hypothetical protein
MKLSITKLLGTSVIIFALAAPFALAQTDTQGTPTAKGQMKAAGKEAGKAGTSLGHNVKRGRVLRGGKRFGKRIGYAGRHVGRGATHAVKTVVKP